MPIQSITLWGRPPDGSDRALVAELGRRTAPQSTLNLERIEQVLSENNLVIWEDWLGIAIGVNLGIGFGVGTISPDPSRDPYEVWTFKRQQNK